MAFQIYPFYKGPDGIFRPWVSVNIINPTTHAAISVLALLDTGADKCVFPKVVADQLGLDLKGAAVGEEIMQGLGAVKIPVWKHEFRIELPTSDKRGIFWKSKNMTIGCVEHDTIPPILGFEDFMCHFKIMFNYATRRIVIDDHPII